MQRIDYIANKKDLVTSNAVNNLVTWITPNGLTKYYKFKVTQTDATILFLSYRNVYLINLLNNITFKKLDDFTNYGSTAVGVDQNHIYIKHGGYRGAKIIYSEVIEYESVSTTAPAGVTFVSAP